MTTSTDGAAPSVTPEPGNGSGPPGVRSRRAARDDPDEALDTGSSWLREEIQRRMAEARTRSGGRHARRDTVASPGSVGYVPRHSVATPGPGAPRPGPVGGSPSPHASELLRRERTSAKGPSAWSGPLDRTDGSTDGSTDGPAPAGDVRTASPSPFPRRVPGTNGAPPRPSPPQASTPAAPAVAPSPRRRVPPSPTPRVAAPSQSVPSPVVLAAPRRQAPDPAAPSPPAASGAVDVSSPATSAPPVETVPAADPTRDPAPDGAPEATEPAAGQPRPGPETVPVPIQQGTQLPLGRPMPGPAWLGPPPGQAPPSADDDSDATAEQPVIPAAVPPAAIQTTEATGPVDSGRGVLGDPVFTARTPEPGSRAREWPVASVPVVVPEQRSADQPGGVAPGEADPDDLQSKRVRVVLAERKTVARPVRMVVDVQEGTGVGEFLRRNLIKTQLTIALSFAIGAGLALGVLPVLFVFVPEIGRTELLGIRLPWLLLGVLVYPFLLGLGYWHSRLAERVEHNFAEDVQG